MSDPSSNLKCYLVGGAVRDRLLGLPETDRDWVVIGHDASEMIRLGFRQVGKDFPVFLQKLKSAQIQWIKYRDALIEMEFPSNQPRLDYGSMYTMCKFYYTKRLTEKRTKELLNYTNNIDCGGPIN